MHFSWGFQGQSRSCSLTAAVLSGCEGQEWAGLKDEGESPSHFPRLPGWEVRCSSLAACRRQLDSFSHSPGLKDQHQTLSSVVCFPWCGNVARKCYLFIFRNISRFSSQSFICSYYAMKEEIWPLLLLHFTFPFEFSVFWARSPFPF